MTHTNPQQLFYRLEADGWNRKDTIVHNPIQEHQQRHNSHNKQKAQLDSEGTVRYLVNNAQIPKSDLLGYTNHQEKDRDVKKVY